MTRENSENQELRSYLLGRIKDEADLLRIEEDLLVGAQHAELEVAEEELIQAYADGELSEEETEAFENRFLVTRPGSGFSKERIRKTGFARALRNYVEKEDAKLQRDAEERTGSWLSGLFKGRGQLFGWGSGQIAVAASLLVVVAVGAYFVLLRSSQTEADRGLASLNKAFQKVRPLSARITGFDYAPHVVTRGNGQPDDLNRIDLQLAERLLLDAAAQDPSAENLHGLGRYYLAVKDFEKAEKELGRAAELLPNDAQIQSDLGTVFLGHALAVAKDEQGKRLELLNKALKAFDAAIRLDPRLPAARFNRAIAEQNVSGPQETIAAWEGYLESDGSSKWAGEACRNLKELGTSNGVALDEKTKATCDRLLSE